MGLGGGGIFAETTVQGGDAAEAETTALTATVAELAARLQRLSVTSPYSDLSTPLDALASASPGGVRTSGEALAVGKSAEAESSLPAGRIQSLRRRFEGVGVAPAPPVKAAPARTSIGAARSESSESSVPPEAARAPAGLGASGSATPGTPVALELQPAEQTALVRYLVAPPDTLPQQPVQAAVLVRVLDGLRHGGKVAGAEALVGAYVDAAMDGVSRATADTGDIRYAVATLANAYWVLNRSVAARGFLRPIEASGRWDIC